MRKWSNPLANKASENHQISGYIPDTDWAGDAWIVVTSLKVSQSLMRSEMENPDEERDRLYAIQYQASQRQFFEARTPWAKHVRKRGKTGSVESQPINFLHYEDELVVFPRNIAIQNWLKYRKDIKAREIYYRRILTQLEGNMDRDDRGLFTFLILPNTFETIMRQIEQYPGPQVTEVVRVLHELYFKGKRPAEVDCKVSTKTLTRYLQRAEQELDILGEVRATRKIGLRTLETSYTALRLARDGQIDIRDYFFGWMF